MTSLRPVTVADVPFLERQNHPDLAGPFGWFGYLTPSLRTRVNANEAITERRGVLAVVDDANNILGDVSWGRSEHAPSKNGWCWNIGIWLHPDSRGKGHGAAAQRELVEYLFAHTTFQRIEADTEAENLAEQRALSKAGFTREGVMRSAAFRAGAYRDMVLYSILRTEL